MIKKHADDLSLRSILNIQTDNIDTTNAKLPINNHALSFPFEVYVNDKYIHHNTDKAIRFQSHKSATKTFTMGNYK